MSSTITGIVKNSIVGGNSGGGVSPLSLGGQFKGFVDNTTVSFPSTTHNYDFVMVNPDISDSNLPFTIQNITFSSKQDRAYYLDGEWHALPAFSNTQGVNSIDPANESWSGIATTQQQINIENKEIINDIRHRNYLLTGYFSAEAPQGNIYENLLWFQTSASKNDGSDLPTTFPIQVKVYKNGAWSSTTQEYTANNQDSWSNRNNTRDYYWFDNSWRINNSAEVEVDGTTIEYNTNGQIQVKKNSLDDDYIKDNSVSLGKLKNVKTSSSNIVNYDNASDDSPMSEKFLQKTLKNIFTPQNSNDAVNKQYVDDSIFNKLHFLGYMSSSNPVDSGYDWTNLIWYNSNLNVGPTVKTFTAQVKNKDGTTSTITVQPKICDVLYNINSNTFFIYNGGNFAGNQLWDIISFKYNSATKQGISIGLVEGDMRFTIRDLMFGVNNGDIWRFPGVFSKKDGKIYYDGNNQTSEYDLRPDVKELVEKDETQTLRNKSIELLRTTSNGTFLRFTPSVNYVSINSLQIIQVGTNLYHFDVLFDIINDPHGVAMFSVKTADGIAPTRPFVVKVASYEKATGGVGVVYEGSGNCYCQLNFSAAEDGKILVSGDFPVG